MKNFSKVFIVILNYNGRDVIKKCLASVFRVDYPNFEVVVVDNNSQDGSFEMARSGFSKAIFIKNEENLGFSLGNNVGIRYALDRAADWVFLLNNDAEVDKDFLGKLVDAAEKDVAIGISSPVIFEKDSGKIWFSGGKIKWFSMKAEHTCQAKTEECFESEFVSGCAMLVKREVFQEIGLLDEDFFLYWEDIDFSVRARRAGFKVMVVSSSWAYHWEKSEAFKKSKVYWLVISGLIFSKKNAPWWLRGWLYFYVKLRKLKNKIDLAYNRNEMAEVVSKAYRDFEKYI
ncbi:MAG: hypothetical protein A2288_00265 [Candidatus Moranbacteria bacterium RIFOXYA12_FULL_44_15]|nr:MAG: hypothetical protein A2288_00265 [Candidatus Moranbacteria bacterium RIFOXYA12_FULL_44_15]OGI34609.1 MAG: hypothetical protein A2259_00525 [Candidatus Moranbacteria bacterium RIFOXYA2_FULL_43_15]